MKGLLEIKWWEMIRIVHNIYHYFLAGGQFAIVSSAAGKAGVPFSGSYTGSKHAINVSN